MKKRKFILISLLLAATVLRGQQYVVLQTGAGLPELLHGGVAWQEGHHMVGLVAGAIPDAYNDMAAAGVYYRRQFGVPSRYPEFTRWYLQVGFHYVYEGNSKRETNDWFLVPRIGREWYINRRWSLAFNLGAAFTVFHGYHDLDPGSNRLRLDLSFPLLPAAGMQLQYRVPVRGRQEKSSISW